MELMKASNEWANRPSEERFPSLTAMHAFTSMQRRLSAGKVLANRAIEARPADSDPRNGLILATERGTANVSHWAFGQLASRAGAPAGYLRTLPAPMAADCINYGLKHARDVEDIGVMVRKSTDLATLPTVAAVTGPNYGRIWNSTITEALVSRFGDGLSGDFCIPGAFKGRVTGTDGPKGFGATDDETTLYAGDRDMFVFLADQTNRIEIPNRRDGKSGTMARGFFVSNSEVGAGTLAISTFLFDYMCCNHIVWGATQYKQVKIRHTAGAPHRWLETALPALEDMRQSGTGNLSGLISNAMRRKVDDVDAFLAKRFSTSQVTGIKAAHVADEGRPIETLWDVTTGITAYARDITYTADRVAIEKIGGDVLDMAA